MIEYQPYSKSLVTESSVDAKDHGFSGLETKTESGIAFHAVEIFLRANG